MSELDNGAATDIPEPDETDDTELDELQDADVPLESDPADWQEQQLEVPDPDPDELR